jgi:cbb3-type cytochrome oxidase subunit 3
METAMWTLLAIAAAASIAFVLIALGVVWYGFRPLTDKERLHQNDVKIPLRCGSKDT